MKSLLRSKTLFTGLFGLLAALAAPAACSSSSSGGGTAGGGNSAGAGGSAAHDGSSGSGGSSASGGSGGGSGGLILDSGTGGGGGLGDGSACELVTQKANLVPLDLYLMLDKSGSMNEKTGDAGPSKWDAVKTALEAFVQDSASVGLGVGLQYFPGSPECLSTTYSTPDVPMATLPGNAGAVATSLDATVPGGQTPTKPALQGAVDYINEWLLQNPTHAGVIVLATDGLPNDCASTVDAVSQIAQAAAADSPKVLTFVIGVGTALSNLDQIAAAGGTTKAFVVDTGGNVTQQFVDALNAIRGGAIACEYLIPTPESGTIDPGKVNVQYTPGSGGNPQTIPNVANAAACPATGTGWYYDNPSAPTKVILCPATCDLVKKDSNAEVGVAFGCKTIIAWTPRSATNIPV